MRYLKKRVVTLEAQRAKASPKSMTDAELGAYIKTFTVMSADFVAAVMTQVMRRGSSSLPIVVDDPDYSERRRAVSP